MTSLTRKHYAIIYVDQPSQRHPFEAWSFQDALLHAYTLHTDTGRRLWLVQRGSTRLWDSYWVDHPGTVGTFPPPE